MSFLTLAFISLDVAPFCHAGEVVTPTNSNSNSFLEGPLWIQRGKGEVTTGINNFKIALYITYEIPQPIT